MCDSHANNVLNHRSMLEAETVAHPFTIKLGLQTNQHNIVVRRSTKKTTTGHCVPAGKSTQ